MKVQNILLTGDDGYDSLGTRLLISALKDSFSLKIAGTKTQQSAVGGMANFKTGGKWGISKVDDIEAFWVSGTPIDAVYCGSQYYKQKFDLVVSGINWGPNIGTSRSSGTIAAALIGTDFYGHAIAVNWNLKPSQWFTHAEDKNVSNDLIVYPGNVVGKFIDRAIENNMWDAQLLNVNLPTHMTKKVIFTKPISNPNKFYRTDVVLDVAQKQYSFKNTIRSLKSDKNIKQDGIAIQNGYISVTPLKTHSLDTVIWDKLKGKKLNL